MAQRILRATPGLWARVSPFESHYLPHKISISSDEQNSITSRTKYKVALKKILLTMQYQLSLLTVLIYYYVR